MAEQDEGRQMVNSGDDHKKNADSAPIKALRGLALALAQGEFDHIAVGDDSWTSQRLKEIVVDEYVQYAREDGSEENPYILEMSPEDLAADARFYGEEGRWRVDFELQWSDAWDYRTVHADVTDEPGGVNVVFLDIEVM